MKPMRVLYVEDLDDARELAELVLGTLGHEVVTAPDGPAALEAITEFRPHVVMLDIGLPKMNGYEVARRIREDSRFDHVVLVAVTGYAEEQDRRRSEEAGFDHHLVKPVDYLRTVRSLLDEVAAGARPTVGEG
jgi:CheY-like chemotaxis protein